MSLINLFISLPEIDPEFDDSDFVTADQMTTNVSHLARYLFSY